MCECLSPEPQDAAVRERLVKHHASIVNQKLHREIISSVDHEIPWLNDFLGVGRIEEFVISGYLYVRIDGNHLLLGTFYFRFVNILGKMDNLALQVAEIDYVGIHNTDVTYTGSSKIQCCRSPQTAGTNN